MLLCLLIFVAALLYSSVGHGGASGYLAAMALMGLPPDVMKPTALSLNIVVASITTYKFYRAKLFSWQMLWPFACLSIPFAFLGGSMTLPTNIYRPVLGIVLLYAAYRLISTGRQKEIQQDNLKPPLIASLICGAGIGFLSGLTGVGGGIFLTPLLVLMGWTNAKTAAGISAGFILVNSMAGLAGHFSSVNALPSNILILAAIAGVGGWIGAEFGSKKLGVIGLRRLLSAVLVIAGFKMLFA